MQTERDYVRREERFCVADLEDLRVIVRRLESAESKEFFADLLDFSRTGVKLEMPFCVQFEEQLLVRFEFVNSDLTYEGTACVRHMRSVGNQIWVVGCSIGPRIPDEIVNYLAAASGKERRRHSRKTVALEGVVLRQGNLDESTAAMQNYSEGGFCMHVPGPYDLGERVRLRLQNTDGYPETISARIRWQKETDEGFEIGCSFADSVGFERLLSCIPDTVLPDKSTGKKPMNWHVVAAALLALFIPPLMCLWIQTGIPLAHNAGTEFIRNSNTAELFQDPITAYDRPRSFVTENNFAGVNSDPGQIHSPWHSQQHLTQEETVLQGPTIDVAFPESDFLQTGEPEFPGFDATSFEPEEASPQIATNSIPDELLENQPYEFNESPSDNAFIPVDPTHEIPGSVKHGLDGSEEIVTENDSRVSLEQNANDRPPETNEIAVDSSPVVELPNKILIRFQGPEIPHRLLQSTPFARSTRTSSTSSSRRQLEVP